MAAWLYADRWPRPPGSRVGESSIRVVFDYAFPNAWPSPVKVPVHYMMGRSRNQEILKPPSASADNAEPLERFSGIHRNKELASTVVFFTFILKGLEQRGRANPFDNRNTNYQGTPDDKALNDVVKRYAPDVQAASICALTTRRRAGCPVPHSRSTPLMVRWCRHGFPNTYSSSAEQGGDGRLFVQQYVKHAGHCGIDRAGFCATAKVEGDRLASTGGLQSLA